MSARDVIANRIAGPNAKNWADATIAALTAVGYRILGPDELDPVTAERCAAICDEAAETSDWIDGRIEAKGLAAAIRTLTAGGER